MGKIENYILELKERKNFDEYLLKNSGLPGPRGNLELLAAVVEVGTEETFNRYLKYTPDIAPVNTPEEFLACCGVAGLGRLVSEGKLKYIKTLRISANDPRWRVREAVAIALQKIGKNDFSSLLSYINPWIDGNSFEQRAVIAGLCEPVLLIDHRRTKRVFSILDRITKSFIKNKNINNDGFIALRKGLGYCWSVAVVADPETGTKYFEKLFNIKDKNVSWIIKENLKKSRLIKMDSDWVKKLQGYLSRDVDSLRI